MKKTIYLLVALALGTTTISCSQSSEQQTSDQTLERVDNTKFKELLASIENAQIIDVRTPEEYNAGKIGDAVNLNFYDDDFKARINALDKTKPVLLYCQGGGRSGKTLKMMEEMDFKTVYELKTGYGGWKE